MPEGRIIREMSLADRNQMFLDAESKIDPAIQIRQFRKVSNWRTMIPRGTYTLGEGLEKKSYRFFPDVGQQRGLQKWHPVQISRKASTGDAGFDAAKYATFLHGKAGDIAAKKKTRASLIATDLIDNIPSAFKDVLEK